MIAKRSPLGLFAAAWACCAGACSSSGDVMDAQARVDSAALDTAAPDSSQPDSGAPDSALGDSAAADSAAPQDAPEGERPPAEDGATRCPASPPEVRVSGEISTNTQWDCAHTYLLTAGPVFVRAPAVLTIGAGTVIRGDAPTASLIVTRGARVEAAGTAEAPIVFTSARPVGMRSRGNWGGVVLLGGASINSARPGMASGINQIEGIDAADNRGQYGGGATPDDDWNCGTLRYVRIEFAGYPISANNELNSLTVGGCGRRTVLDYVQVHRGEDDGFEFFGGTADLRHAIATHSDDDGLDWDFGWRGRAQFVVVTQSASTESDPSGVEADNDRDNNNAMPRSEPVIYNLTLLGPEGMNTMPGMVLRRGTAARIYNSVIMNWGAGAIDVRDPATAALATAGSPTLFVNNSLFFRNGPTGTNHFALDMGSDMGFDEDGFFRAPARMNRFDLDPALAAPTHATAPDFAPSAASPASSGAATPPSDGAFFLPAPFLGAIPPGPGPNWTTGWTAFPAN
ncbi:MAG: hypothetical protein HY909_23305 [Deltaproteobacteria bacterium]|nr:hypothetical protein [Deltaproteobacteria bacterium]